MRYVAAYLLAALGGNESPGAGDLKKILDSVGIEADDTRMEKVPTAFCCALFWCCGSVSLPAANYYCCDIHKVDLLLNRSSLNSRARMWMR